MNVRDRAHFDALVDEIVAGFPAEIRSLFDETPLLVDDAPTQEMMRHLGLDSRNSILCGLHSGIPLTERTVLAGDQMPDVIHIFREGIVQAAGGWKAVGVRNHEAVGGEEAVAREIRITILHELGHHFGLDEDDLAALGYG
ncbi:MAG TPA: metallopeptidase family protein [Phycisphaerales bacterium]|nr:metallopeptidase family protein [Phycisphaerales bacterium]